jgi:hypothetical protein
MGNLPMTDLIIGPPPETRWQALRKVLHFRSDRDLTDYLNLVAVLAALAMPFVLRACNRAENRPSVELSVTYLRRLKMPKDKEIITRLVAASNPVRLMTEEVPHGQYVRNSYIYAEYRVFRVTAINKKDIPVSIQRFRVEKLVTRFPHGVWEHLWIFLYKVPGDFMSVDPYPVVNLGPGQSEHLIMVAARPVLLFDNPSVLDQLHSDTMRAFSNLQAEGKDTVPTDCFPIPCPSVTGHFANVSTVYYPVFEEDILRKGVMTSLQISAVDNQGNRVLSNVTKGIEQEDGHNELTW